MIAAEPKFKMIYILTILLVIYINQASTTESSGLLARLYKQAAQENRPVVLVLDNSDYGQRKDVANPNRLLGLDSVDTGVNKQFMYMYPKGEFQKTAYGKPGKAKTHKDLTDRESRISNRDKRLKHRHNRDRRVELDRYDEQDARGNRYKYRVKSSQDTDKRQDKRQNRNKRVDGNRDEDRDRLEIIDRRERLRWENDDDEKAVLRSPVIRNLLRISNNLQCDAKDRCHDKCNGKFNGDKLDDCEDKCEVKFDCEKEHEEESDRCERGECEESNECGASEECAISTKGERFVTVTPKCKRC